MNSTVQGLSPSEKRSVSQSMKKAKDQFVESNKTHSTKTEMKQAFYDFWIASSIESKYAWIYEKETNLFKAHHLMDEFKQDIFEKIEELFTQEETAQMIRPAAANMSVIANRPNAKPERKIGRNELCFCGSQKKYKKCCIN